MSKVKILIVEDELLTATDIKEQLESIGYEIIHIARTAGEAIRLCRKTLPDIILMDITLEGKMDGIEAAEVINSIWQGPIIFLTAYSHKDLVERAKKTMPAAYILKPFNINEFSITIEIAIHNYLNQLQHFSSNYLPDAIFVPVNYTHQKIIKSDLLFVEADGSYVRIKTIGKDFIVSTNIGNLERQLNDPRFVRISRKHIVNLCHIEKVEGNTVFIKKHHLTVGESFRNALIQNLQIIKTK